ncbi:MAG: hypothetical protein H7Z75_01880, partial [Ferruginibacter sp.]|nr:hypothetical protein [Cytophagales bacterium]
MATSLFWLPPAVHRSTRLRNALVTACRTTGCWAVLAGWLLATAAQAQPQLLKDINAAPANSPYFGPINLTDVGRVLYFSAANPANGRELWTSDGTPEGTRLIKDLRPGLETSNPTNLTNVGGVLYFTADDGTTGTELYRSAGTPESTRLVKDITLGPAPSSLSKLTSAGGLLFFAATDPSTPSRGDLWRSDGTAEGTRPLRCSCPEPPDHFNPSQWMAVGGVLYFVADIGINDRQLWQSDGTEAGTVLIKDLYAPPGISSDKTARHNLTNVGGVLFFTDINPVSNGRELWKSDGTPAGTVLVKTVSGGGGSPYTSSIGGLTDAGGTLYFVAGEGLYKSDGTPAGTSLVKSGGSGRYALNFSNLTSVDTMLFFVVSGLDRPEWELWKSDGTPEGT